MAKFYQRYLPPPAEKTIQYGYRGTNYTINGQFYTGSNNLEQVGNYQYNPACIDLGCTVAPIAVDSLFEPTYQGSVYDLTGSRFSGEWSSGKFQYYGTYKDSNNNITFKNQTCQGMSCFCVNTETSVACLTGCVLPGSCQICAAWNGQINNLCPTNGYNSWSIPCATTGINNSGGTFSSGGPSVSNNVIQYNCCANYNYLTVEAPVGTYTCFVPQTNMYQSMFLCGCCICLSNCAAIPEFTFGDNCTTGTGCSTGWGMSSYVCGPLSSGLVSNACVFFPALCTIAALQSKELGDSQYYGVAGRTNLVASSNSTCCCSASQNIFGTYLNYGDARGTVEFGVRTFIQNAPPYKWYFHYNASNGGIQGVDTTTSTNVRLTLRQFNTNTSVTTVVYSIKKGISGLVIPSQPDRDDTVAYRFYHIAFNGADTANSITISRYTLTSATGVAAKQDYTLTQTAGDITSIYTALGHNNSAASKLNNPNFRRQTVNRVWYSLDANSVKRLHMGVYNTNGTGLVTIASGFNLDANTGSMFRIWSWSLDDVGFTASYLGYVSLATYAPRYFCPLTTSWTTIYAGSTFGNDVTLTLNATTGLYQYQSTMPYIAARLFKDKDGRWATQVLDTTIVNTSGGWTANTTSSTLGLTSNVTSNYIDIITSDVGQTLLITASQTSFVYAGATVAGNISVNVYNYLGNRIAKTVALAVVGQTASPGISFNDGTYATTITTSAAGDTVVGILLISSANAKIVGTVADT